MTVTLFSSAPPAARANFDEELAGLARLARLEETLEASLAASRSDQELVQEIALAKAVSSVALFAGSEDCRIEAALARVVEQAYDACLAGLAGAYAGDHAALESALSAVRSIRVSVLRERQTTSTPPRAA